MSAWAPGGSSHPQPGVLPETGIIYDPSVHSFPSTWNICPIYKTQVHMMKPSFSLVSSFTGYSFRKFFPRQTNPGRGSLYAAGWSVLWVSAPLPSCLRWASVFFFFEGGSGSHPPLTLNSALLNPFLWKTFYMWDICIKNLWKQERKQHQFPKTWYNGYIC